MFMIYFFKTSTNNWYLESRVCLQQFEENGLLWSSKDSSVEKNILLSQENIFSIFVTYLTWFFGEECLFLEMPVGFVS